MSENKISFRFFLYLPIEIRNIIWEYYEYQKIRDNFNNVMKSMLEYREIILEIINSPLFSIGIFSIDINYKLKNHERNKYINGKKYKITTRIKYIDFLPFPFIEDNIDFLPFAFIEDNIKFYQKESFKKFKKLNIFF